VIAVPLDKVLHLKSVTALSDGTFLLQPQLVPARLSPAVLATSLSGHPVARLCGDDSARLREHLALSPLLDLVPVLARRLA
jgi:hypothetical protein